MLSIDMVPVNAEKENKAKQHNASASESLHAISRLKYLLRDTQRVIANAERE